MSGVLNFEYKTKIIMPDLVIERCVEVIFG